MAEFTTFKRWRARHQASQDEVVRLVRDEIAPAYAKLPGCLKIGLLYIDGTRSYLATQHWQSRTARMEALAAPEYANWLAEYEPALARWHELMEFEDEWETEDILGNA